MYHPGAADKMFLMAYTKLVKTELQGQGLDWGPELEAETWFESLDSDEQDCLIVLSLGQMPTAYPPPGFPTARSPGR
jgi:hypothetical protein